MIEEKLRGLCWKVQPSFILNLEVCEYEEDVIYL